ncbi:MIP/aquaporin family protein [Nakamurella antarctica]
MLGSAILLLIGGGAVANVTLKGTKGYGADWFLITFAWGIAVFAGVFVAFRSGAHLNPAITIGLAIADKTAWSDVPAYIGGQLVGAFIGAVLAWLAYRDHFAAEKDPIVIRDAFVTSPAIRNLPWNVVTEVIATFVLVLVVLMFGGTPSNLGPLAVALLVVGIGAGLGGPTGYAINPTRDLGPRIAHAVLPIPSKGGSDWSYAWVPIVGPIVGGVLAASLFNILGVASLMPTV